MSKLCVYMEMVPSKRKTLAQLVLQKMITKWSTLIHDLKSFKVRVIITNNNTTSFRNETVMIDKETGETLEW